MPTGIRVTATVTIADVKPICQSVAAHLAAKLQSFASDERTLTDELCDMTCIWLDALGSGSAKGFGAFTLQLQKTTAPEEVRIGADLELVISTPLGSKRCLLQAKVLDPGSLKLRCASQAGWRKLRTQLKKARKAAGDLAFLMVYVPGGLLDKDTYGYGTYEQNFLGTPPYPKESFWGATVIACDDLLRPDGKWKFRERVRHDSAGKFVDGVPFWQFLIEVMLCRRGVWMDSLVAPSDDADHPRFGLYATAEGIEGDSWRMLEQIADEWLPREKH